MGLHDRNLETAALEPTMESATLMHAGYIVRQFLVYLKENPIEDVTIIDIDRLPVAKSSLINAFRLLIASEERLQQRAQLQKVGLLLAQFQGSGEQEEPTSSADSADDALVSWIDTVADEPVSHQNSWLAVYREQERLAELFDISARMAQRRDIAISSVATDDGQANRLPH